MVSMPVTVVGGVVAVVMVAERIEFRQANALALPFPNGSFDHVWSYAVTMNIADKAGLGREVARVLKPGGRFSCNEIARRSGGAPVFPLPWASEQETSFLVSPTGMRAALEAGGLSLIEQADLTATRLGETGRQPVTDNPSPRGDRVGDGRLRWPSAQLRIHRQ